MGFYAPTSKGKRQSRAPNLLLDGPTASGYRFGGQTFRTPGRQSTAVEDDRARLIERTRMLDEVNRAREEFQAFDQAYRPEHTGERALETDYDYAAYFDKALPKRRYRISDPAIRNELDDRLQAVRTAGLDVAARWKLQQERQWRADTVDAMFGQTLETILDPTRGAEETVAETARYLQARDDTYPGDLAERDRQDAAALDQAVWQRNNRTFRDYVKQNPWNALLLLKSDHADKLAVDPEERPFLQVEAESLIIRRKEESGLLGDALLDRMDQEVRRALDGGDFSRLERSERELASLGRPVDAERVGALRKKAALVQPLLAGSARESFAGRYRRLEEIFRREDVFPEAGDYFAQPGPDDRVRDGTDNSRFRARTTDYPYVRDDPEQFAAVPVGAGPEETARPEKELGEREIHRALLVQAEEVLRQKEKDFLQDPAAAVADSPLLSASGVSFDEFLKQKGMTAEAWFAASIKEQKRIGEGLDFMERLLPRETVRRLIDRVDAADTREKKAAMLLDLTRSGGRYATRLFAEIYLPKGLVAFGRILPELPQTQVEKLLAAAEPVFPARLNAALMTDAAGRDAGLAIPDAPWPVTEQARQRVAASPIMAGFDAVAAALGEDEESTRSLRETLERFVSNGGDLERLESAALQSVEAASEEEIRENPELMERVGVSLPGGNPAPSPEVSVGEGMNLGPQSDIEGEAVPEGRSWLDKRLHEMGVAFRGQMDGLLGLLDLPGSLFRIPLNWINGALGGDPEYFQPAKGNLPDALGMPEPENRFEEIGQDVNRVGAEVVASYYAASTKAAEFAVSKLPSLFQSVLPTFRAPVSEQMAGGLMSEAAVQTANHMGAGPIGTAVAGTLGGSVPTPRFGWRRGGGHGQRVGAEQELGISTSGENRITHKPDSHELGDVDGQDRGPVPEQAPSRTESRKTTIHSRRAYPEGNYDIEYLETTCFESYLANGLDNVDIESLIRLNISPELRSEKFSVAYDSLKAGEFFPLNPDASGRPRVKLELDANPLAEEIRAAQIFAGKGYNVTHLKEMGDYVKGVSTADLSVEGFGRVDVYTPTGHLNTVVRKIGKKEEQAETVLVQLQTDASRREDISCMVFGESTNIKCILFEDGGDILVYKRPKE